MPYTNNARDKKTLKRHKETVRCVAWNPHNSAVSILSDYGLDDQAIGVRSPAGAKDFSSILCVQTGSGAHPASCTMGTGNKAQTEPVSTQRLEENFFLPGIELRSPGRSGCSETLYWLSYPGSQMKK
jgi:hypothetical protein